MPEPHPTDGPVHEHFGLTYANYLVLPRTLMQSMPISWQTRMVACLDELHDAFRHIEQAEAYEVVPGVERTVSELSDLELKRARYSVDWYGGEQEPQGVTALKLREWQAAHEKEPVYYDRNLDEVDAETRVVVPSDDPVPHYNRGRTYIEPATT